MKRAAHTTKRGPGRRHVENTYRNGRLHSKREGPTNEPGVKLIRAAIRQTIGVRWPS